MESNKKCLIIKTIRNSSDIKIMNAFNHTVRLKFGSEYVSASELNLEKILSSDVKLTSDGQGNSYLTKDGIIYCFRFDSSEKLVPMNKKTMKVKFRGQK